MKFLRLIAKERFSAVEIFGYGLYFVSAYEGHWLDAAVLWVLTFVLTVIVQVAAKEREA